MNEPAHVNLLTAAVVLLLAAIVLFTQCNISPLVPDPTATWTPTEPPTHIPSRTLTATPTIELSPTRTYTRTFTRTATATSSPELTPTRTRTASPRPSFTSTAASTNTRQPTPLLPTLGGKVDPGKCYSGYEFQFGAIGKDLVIYLNCLDDELSGGTD